MKIETTRELLLTPLQVVVGVVEKRQTMPILSHVLLTPTKKGVTFTTSDLEVELCVLTDLPPIQSPLALPARKLLDILKALSADNAAVSLMVEADRVTVRSGKSRFTLTTLAAEDFPHAQIPEKWDAQITLSQQGLRQLIERSQFAMAQQDVRYYLNGLLLELSSEAIRAVATDGHRLACTQLQESAPLETPQQVIVPRKGVLELLRLLKDDEASVTLCLGRNQLQAQLENLQFTTKLVDGKFPDYQRVIPQDPPLSVIVDRRLLKETLNRVAVVSSDKQHRGVKLSFNAHSMRIQAQGSEHDEAEDEIEIDYSGETLEMAFNVSFLIEALSALSGDQIRIGLTDVHSSALLRELENDDCRFVVMPMRL